MEAGEVKGITRDSWLVSLTLSALLVLYRLIWNWERFQWLDSEDLTWTAIIILNWALICFLIPPTLASKVPNRSLRLTVQIFLHALVYLIVTLLALHHTWRVSHRAYTRRRHY